MVAYSLPLPPPVHTPARHQYYIANDFTEEPDFTSVNQFNTAK